MNIGEELLGLLLTLLRLVLMAAIVVCRMAEAVGLWLLVRVEASRRRRMARVQVQRG